jgi:hypothetical protein
MGSGPSAMCWPPPNVTGGRTYKILWHSNQFGVRGTEIALFDYAAAFEDLLCGVSHIQSFQPNFLNRGQQLDPKSKSRAKRNNNFHIHSGPTIHDRCLYGIFLSLRRTRSFIANPADFWAFYRSVFNDIMVLKLIMHPYWTKYTRI